MVQKLENTTDSPNLLTIILTLLKTCSPSDCGLAAPPPRCLLPRVPAPPTTDRHCGRLGGRGCGGHRRRRDRALRGRSDARRPDWRAGSSSGEQFIQRCREFSRQKLL